MNKRIKELAQFNEHIRNFFETGPVQRAAIEEFAQLIVRECMLQIADVRIEHDFDLTVDEVSVQALTGIKKQFGIKP
jgi:hypothetical protein